jgi:hypothetical protein
VDSKGTTGGVNTTHFIYVDIYEFAFIVEIQGMLELIRTTY